MLNQVNITDLYRDHQVPNPINFTLTFKQRVDGQKLDQFAAVLNVRHFRNRLNRKLFGNAYKRHGKQLKMLIVHEGTEWTRHHVHGIIERPEAWAFDDFMALVTSTWSQTRFGYHEHHYEAPATAEREAGWLDYCLKKRTKSDLASSVDWENSTCFERR